jgi:hypothetical protein
MGDFLLAFCDNPDYNTTSGAQGISNRGLTLSTTLKTGLLTILSLPKD